MKKIMIVLSLVLIMTSCRKPPTCYVECVGENCEEDMREDFCQ